MIVQSSGPSNSFDNKKILMLTSTNLACNPRCLKEVQLLHRIGANTTVLDFKLHNWTDHIEVKLQRELQNVKFNSLEGTRREFFPWLAASMSQYSAKLFLQLFSGNLKYCGLAVGKHSWLLYQRVKKNTQKFDLIIAHNPPAFFPAYWLSKKMNIPFALDIEDYHPGENNGEIEKNAVEYLMKFLIPKTAYVSFASPLILKQTVALLKGKQTNNLLLINNAFLSGEFPEPEVSNDLEASFKLVWFSQVIDYKRGLERILPLLDAFAGEIKLTLIGNLREGFYMSEIKHRPYITSISAIPQKDLHIQLRDYDAGLALEDNTTDFNRDICLTNKIWAYLQSGLYILATETSAQLQFLAEHPAHGEVCSSKKLSFSEQFSKILSNKTLIRLNKNLRYNEAKSFAWDIDAELLKNTWLSVLQ